MTNPPENPSYNLEDEDTDEDTDDSDFPDPASTPIPAVVGWEDLDAFTYATELHALDEWVLWLCRTYHQDTSTIPNCWYQHADLREELGHLHTGWMLTRHPEAGIGMIGLEWDRHRDTTLGRCRTMTGAAGCTPAAGHKDRIPRLWPADRADNLAAHVSAEWVARDSAGITRAAAAAAESALAEASNPGSALAAIQEAIKRAGWAMTGEIADNDLARHAWNIDRSGKRFAGEITAGLVTSAVNSDVHVNPEPGEQAWIDSLRTDG